jgi:hypothetical protein
MVAEGECDAVKTRVVDGPTVVEPIGGICSWYLDTPEARVRQSNF